MSHRVPFTWMHLCCISYLTVHAPLCISYHTVHIFYRPHFLLWLIVPTFSHTLSFLPTLAFLRTLATCAFRTFILTYPFYFLLSSPLSYFILYFFLLFYVISYCNLLHTHTSCTLSRLLLHAHNLSIVII